MTSDLQQVSAEPTDGVLPATPATRSRPSLWWFIGPILALLTVAGIGSALIRVPYVSIAPGKVYSTEPSIFVPEGQGFESDGTVSYTTVSVRDVTLLEAILGWLDPATQVVPTEDQRGTLSREQSRLINQERMETSKQIAKKVAFEQLGYEVPVNPGDGSLVMGVQPGTAAARELREGDTIVGINGVVVQGNDDLTGELEAKRPGDEITLTVQRAGEEGNEDVTVELTETPEAPGRAIIGVTIQTRGVTYAFPFEVDIDSGDVGGPSAGLAFTLGILDRLTPGELTGGVPVAATGTIEPDGSVGPVGGVVQKTEAAERAGIELFIVPSAEYEAARAHAGDGLRVERADTLEEALEILGTLGGNALALGTPGSEVTEGT